MPDLRNVLLVLLSFACGGLSALLWAAPPAWAQEIPTRYAYAGVLDYWNQRAVLTLDTATGALWSTVLRWDGERYLFVEHRPVAPEPAP